MLILWLLCATSHGSCGLPGKPQVRWLRCYFIMHTVGNKPLICDVKGLLHEKRGSSALRARIPHWRGRLLCADHLTYLGSKASCLWDKKTSPESRGPYAPWSEFWSPSFWSSVGGYWGNSVCRLTDGAKLCLQGQAVHSTVLRSGNVSVTDFFCTGSYLESVNFREIEVPGYLKTKSSQRGSFALSKTKLRRHTNHYNDGICLGYLGWGGVGPQGRDPGVTWLGQFYCSFSKLTFPLVTNGLHTPWWACLSCFLGTQIPLCVFVSTSHSPNMSPQSLLQSHSQAYLQPWDLASSWQLILQDGFTGIPLEMLYLPIALSILRHWTILNFLCPP